MQSHLDTAIKQSSFSRHLLRGDYGSALLMSGLEWLPESLNMPEEEILKQTDEKFTGSLTKFCDENTKVFESVSDDAKTNFLGFVHRYLYSNRLREGICKIIARKAMLSIQPPFMVIDTKDMAPSYKQALIDSFKGNKKDILPTFYDCNQCQKDLKLPVTRMLLCPDCGNKRCPQAINHRFKCTGSNEPDQTNELKDEFKNLGEKHDNSN
jgi:hypothetical protein